MTYCDTTVDRWWRSVGLGIGEHEWDCMVVKAVLEWKGSAKYSEDLDVEVHASRWGNTSFDVTCIGTVGERPIFTGTITYVSVRHGTTETTPVPEKIKAALSDS